MVALGSVQVPAHLPRVSRDRRQPGVGGQPVGGAERGGKVAAGVGEQFGAQDRPESVDAGDDVGMRVLGEPGGELFVQVPEPAVIDGEVIEYAAFQTGNGSTP